MKLFFCTLIYSMLAGSLSAPNVRTKSIFTLRDFSKIVDINGKATALAGVEFPVRLTLLPEKGVFMCLDTRPKKKCLNIYSIDSIKLIRSVINNGSADGEMLGAFQLQYNKRNGGEIYITDFQKQQIFVYKADSLIAGNERPLKIIGNPFNGPHGFSINQNRLLRAVIIDKSYNFVDTRASASNHSRMLLNKYRSDLSVRDSFGLYPKTTDDIAPFMLSQVISGCLGISTDNKYVVFNSTTTDYLSVYDTSGKMIASAIGPGELDVSYKIEKAGNGERIIPSSGHDGYAGRAQINNGSIYVLYNGKDRKAHDYHASDLFQFTNNLHPEIRYKLNIPIYDLEIDWRKKRIYGLRMEGSTPQMVIFQL